MARKNINLTQLQGCKTYTEIVNTRLWSRVEAHQLEHPEREIFVMAFGDTSQPLPASVGKALVNSAYRSLDPQTCKGYESFLGNPDLRQGISTHYYREKLGVDLDWEEIFISDGAQSVSVNIQELFAGDSKVAIPNPAYPSFVEGTLLADRPSIYLPCDESGNFVPAPPNEPVDLIYLCFPNNPTGTVATSAQLQAFVDYARTHKAVIVYDAVYSFFVTTPDIPRSIYEIEGAKECAIEIGSFSKWANFTGLRVGWVTIPKALTIRDTVPGELNELWQIRHAVKFWGTASIAQHGAIAALSPEGQRECEAIVRFYLQNARLLRDGLEAAGLKCFGSINSPFVWVKAPVGWGSWQFFDRLLRSTGIVGVPGCIFGSLGEGYLRLSALGQRQNIEGAVSSLSQYTTVV